MFSPVKKVVVIIFLFFMFFHPFPFTLFPVYADEIEDLQKQIDELNKSRELSVAATKPLEGQLEGYKRQLAQIKVGLQVISSNINQKEKELKVREDKLVLQQALLHSRVRAYYIRSYLQAPFLVILGSSSSGDLLRELTYRQVATREDKSVIASVTSDMLDLLIKKDKLESDKAKLANLQSQVDKNAQFIEGEVKKAKAYQTDLSQKIADLSAKQQAILAARSGSFVVSIGDSELADDVNASIKGFREQAPSGSFALFSFGGHTHRKGMSQYGARGRAQSGQNYKAILKAYYGKEPVGKDTNGTIKVSGFGDLDFESSYLFGIAEMPSSWHPEALKSQAVAARSYAYRYKQEGKEICTTETCQVFRKSKSDNPPGEWRGAVEATRGEVVEDVVAYYSSTTGGYLSTMGWDTTDGGGGSNFVDKAYEKLGGSPWVYKAWYTKGYSPGSDKCGRSNPWLSSSELADIVNAALVLRNGTSEETKKITPVTTSCWGGEPYSHEELKSIAGKYGGINSVSSVAVTQGDGETREVVINNISFAGADFRRAFNLRAPGYLSIPQSGFAFFNIERK